MIYTAATETIDLSVPMSFASYNSPFGTIYAAMQGTSLIAMSFCARADELRNLLERRFGDSLTLCLDSSALEPLFTLLERYFAGHVVEFNLPVKLYGTVFQQSVWKAVSEIPRGHVDTYAAIASKIGRRRACRAVATACGRNMVPVIIPCHRVVSSSGSTGGWSGGGGLSVKEGLLRLEGVNPKNLKSLIKL